MHPNLSFEQAPPISVPYRFFLSAPWFGVAAGLLLLVAGDEVVASRWGGLSLGVTHLLTAGFMLQAMAGALLQFVPVAAGGNVWRPQLVANLVHPALVLAAVLLVAAFLSGQAPLFHAAGGLFVLAVGLFVAVVSLALFTTPATGATILTLRLVVPALLVTVVLGATLAVGISGGLTWPLVEMTNVHAAWGLGGWGLLLLAGVSYYVVPMFQLTPAYPAWLTRGLAPALLAILLVWSLQLGGNNPSWQTATWLLGVLAAATYAAVTLRLQVRRRRKVTDPTFWFFRGAMTSMLLVMASALAMSWLPALAGDPRNAYWLGSLAIVGVFMSAINGMLYKIVPFLNWLHLQRLASFGTLPPNMRDMIPERMMMVQLSLHYSALASLLAGTGWPPLTRVGGAMLAISCAVLAWNLTSGVRNFLRFKDRMNANAPGPAR